MSAGWNNRIYRNQCLIFEKLKFNRLESDKKVHVKIKNINNLMFNLKD